MKAVRIRIALRVILEVDVPRNCEHIRVARHANSRGTSEWESLSRRNGRYRHVFLAARRLSS